MNIKSACALLIAVIAAVLGAYFQPEIKEVKSVEPKKKQREYNVTLNKNPILETWVLRKHGVLFLFKTTPVGKLIVEENAGQFNGIFNANYNTASFFFPKQPEELQYGERVAGTIGVIFDTDEVGTAQDAVMIKVRRDSDGRTILRITSGTETSAYKFKTEWLYQESNGYMLPDQLVHTARSRFNGFGDDGSSIMNAVAVGLTSVDLLSQVGDAE